LVDDLSVPVSTGVSQSLPSLDDFRRRDEAKQAAERAEKAAVKVEKVETPLTEAEARLQKGKDALYELLTFDTVDERPAGEDQVYDLTARLIGRGLPNKTGAYLLPYLQSGHMILILVLLLSTFVTYPGFPLTQVPEEYRELLRQGFLIAYAINAACAVYSIGISQSKEQPVVFWCAKIFLLGGLALGELTEAVPDPAKLKGGKARR